MTALFTDGNLVDTEVVSWTLKDPSALKKEGGSTQATGQLVGDHHEVTATFTASDKESTPSVTGITVGDRPLENFEPEKTYYRLSLPYTATTQTVAAQASGYQVTVQQASDSNDHQASIFLSAQN